MVQQKIRNYYILGEIASGGFGTVYRAWDANSGQVVALKELRPDDSTNDDDIERFRREALLTSSIDHPNVVRVFEAFKYDDRHFIAMELLAASVRDLIQATGWLPMAKAVAICRQAALGLEAARQRGVTHRDIKPANMLVAADGAVKVSDFGLARASSMTTITNTGVPLGTIYYTSPEEFQNTRADTRSDIYSLGITLYEMLNGCVPFSDESPYVIMRQHVEDQPIPIRRKRPEVSHKLAAIVDRCLHKDPNRRYQTPGELAAALSSPSITDWTALVALYDATNGDDWENNDNWLTDAPLGDWYGIETDANGRVTKIEFDDNGLSGRLPHELGNLTNLRHLWFTNDHNIEGEIPRELSNLTNLEKIVFTSCNLSGRIPRELGNLTNLEWLSIIDNPLIGEIPSELYSLTNLEDLTLLGIGLTGQLSPELGNLTKLTRLDLSGNFLSGEIPHEMGCLTNLRYLMLCGNNFSGEIPTELSNLTQLEKFCIEGNDLTGELPDGLQGLDSGCWRRH